MSHTKLDYHENVNVAAAVPSCASMVIIIVYWMSYLINFCVVLVGIRYTFIDFASYRLFITVFFRMFRKYISNLDILP